VSRITEGTTNDDKILTESEDSDQEDETEIVSETKAWTFSVILIGLNHGCQANSWLVAWTRLSSIEKNAFNRSISNRVQKRIKE